MHISSDSFRTVHQKTVHHNLGRRGPKELALNALAYCSGISASVALFVSSQLDPRIRPLAFLNKTQIQMREMAEENNFSIPKQP